MKALCLKYGSVILVTWHGNSLIPIARSYGQGYVGLVSLSRDGDLLAEFLHQMRWQTIRGSTSRGAARVARFALDALSRPGTVLAITPDGPRGPACKVQPGALFLAQKSGKPLVIVGIGVRRAWRLKSWDSFLIPQPFSPVRWIFGPPVFIFPGDDLASASLKLEDALNAVNAEAMQGWAKEPESHHSTIGTEAETSGS